MRRRGFSLAEILFSFTLTSIVLVLVLNVFPTSMLSVRTAEQRQIAGSICDSLLERKAALSFPSLPLGLSEDAEVSHGDLKFSTHFEVIPVEGRNPDFLRCLRARVAWETNGRPLVLERELWVHRLASEKL